MKTQHTPGPWRANISTPSEENKKWGGNCGANASISAPTDQRIFGRDPRKVIVYLPHWREEAETPEQRANAALIAAAPDMLQALVTIKNVLTDWNKDGQYTNLIEHAATQIKRATEI